MQAKQVHEHSFSQVDYRFGHLVDPVEAMSNGSFWMSHDETLWNSLLVECRIPPPLLLNTWRLAVGKSFTERIG